MLSNIKIGFEHLSDMDLVLKSISGDQTAFSIIVQRHKSKIAATVFGMLGESMEAEDIGHEVFIRFYNSLENFRANPWKIPWKIPRPIRGKNPRQIPLSNHPYSL